MLSGDEETGAASNYTKRGYPPRGNFAW